MTPAIIRNTQPGSLRCFLPYLLNKGTATFEQLVCALATHGITKTESRNIVENTILDGLLVFAKGKKPNHKECCSTTPKRRAAEKLRLPNLNEIDAIEIDPYCFECHLPGVLEKCRKCHRTFHSGCTREHAERPLYKIPSAKLQKNRLPEFSSESNAGSDETDNDNEHDSNENELRTTSSLTQAYSCISQQFITDDNIALEVSSASAEQLPFDSSENTYEHKPLFDSIVGREVEEKAEKVDVLCVGEVRAPTRRRPATTASTISYKSELATNDEELANESKHLCTCCRLLDTAALRNPANMQPDELCHLLNYTFTRNRSWVTRDVLSYLHAKKITKEELKVITQMLFIHPVPYLNNIAEKLQENQYHFLMEFLIDILDLQHSIGVFFGSDSMEYDATKWLARDIQHDIAEIRRCPDCYRYSTEKLSDLWFALPCVQRHELVYAKQSGFPFWPAKVIRVLPNNKYDVRFFGTDHSRALIHARFIRSIDTNVKTLKQGNTTALKKAMEELRYHQQFSNIYSSNDFSFYADPLEIVKKIQNVMGENVLNVTRGPRRRNTIVCGFSTPPTATDINDVLGNPSTTTTPRRPATTLKRKIQNINENNNNLYLPGDGINDFECRTLSSAKRRTPSNACFARSTANNADLKKSARGRSRVTRSTSKAAEPKLPQEFADMAKQHEQALNVIDEFHRKFETQRKKIQSLKAKIKVMDQQMNIIKRQPWCCWCLEPATYLCCFRATYCSIVCQKRHWKDRHYKECKHKSDMQSKELETNCSNMKRSKHKVP